jgi:hypothetical protein
MGRPSRSRSRASRWAWAAVCRWVVKHRPGPLRGRQRLPGGPGPRPPRPGAPRHRPRLRPDRRDRLRRPARDRRRHGRAGLPAPHRRRSPHHRRRPAPAGHRRGRRRPLPLEPCPPSAARPGHGPLHPPRTGRRRSRPGRPRGPAAGTGRHDPRGGPGRDHRDPDPAARRRPAQRPRGAGPRPARDRLRPRLAAEHRGPGARRRALRRPPRGHRTDGQRPHPDPLHAPGAQQAGPPLEGVREGRLLKGRGDGLCRVQSTSARPVVSSRNPPDWCCHSFA